MAFTVYASGTLNADGTEQDVMSVAVASMISGHLSLANMQAGDTVVLKQYLANQLWASGEYIGVQTDPRVHFTPKAATSMKVTLQQTAGANKSFAYEFMEEEIPDLADVTAIKDKTDSIHWDDITTIKGVTVGRWVIENNQLIFYDGLTELVRFNLKDKFGQPAETNIYDRIPV